MMEIKVGDLVKLKSGGPLMVVSFKITDSRVRCSWMDWLGRYHSAEFPLEILKKVGG